MLKPFPASERQFAVLFRRLFLLPRQSCCTSSSMEQRLQNKLQQLLLLKETTEQNKNTTSVVSLHSLSLARSLIINPSTSETTISSIFETLANSLHPDRDPLSLHHVLSLLSDLAAHRPQFSHPVFNSVRAFSLLRDNLSTPTLTDALSVLVSIAESDEALIPELREDLFLYLIFQPCVSARYWLLMNAKRCPVRPSLLLTVLLGFTKDPYPYVKRAALDGLVSLGKSIVVEDHALVDGCYCRAVELLSDMEDCVRAAAVRGVSEWGRLHVASDQDKSKEEWSDTLFVQLCSMVRDMSLEVRIEAFDALGKIAMVSEDILLQTVSKRVLPNMKQKKYPWQSFTKQIELTASNAAGAFVHGLEDEFFEVRRSACQSLCTLTALSAKFSSEALNFLMDVLNDDSLVVRLEALKTMHHMAIFDCLEVEATHMHMFLGSLVDTSASIRSAARRILQSIKLNDIAMFKLLVEGLLESVDVYPQDEAEVFSVIYNIGQRHGKFAMSFLKEFSGEIEPGRDGKLVFESTRVAALLVLTVSVPLSNEQSVCSIPPQILPYAVKLLGRVSPVLNVYLSGCSKSSVISAVEFSPKEEEPFLPVTKGHTPQRTGVAGTTPGMHLEHISNGVSGTPPQKSGELEIPLVDSQLKDHEVTKTVELMLTKVKDIWQLIQCGCINEVQMTLRSWKEELVTFTSDAYSDLLGFVLQYIRVMKLLAKAWMYFRSPRKSRSYGMIDLSLVLGKLGKILGNIRYRFIGLSKEEESHILELVLLSCIMRLCSVEGCMGSATMKKLYSTVSCLDFLYQEGSIKPSNFVIELKKLLCDIGPSADGASHSPILFQKIVDFFSPRELLLRETLKHIKAELDVQDNDFDNPLSYISGLPVGIPFEIALYNVSRESRLWLRMTLYEELAEFIFLDLDQLGGSDEIRKLTFVAPFYRTMKASSIILRACIGMECSSEYVNNVKRHGGPKHELTYLCKEKQVYLSMVVKD